MSGFNTSLLHDGVDDYPNGATLVPIYQSSAFKHESAEELERIFDNKAMGFSYTRINNPTIEAFEKRITKLEKGFSSVACSSGMAAIFNSIANIVRQGDEVVASCGLYGGTVELFEDLESFGITVKYVADNKPECFEELITDKTRASNPPRRLTINHLLPHKNLYYNSALIISAALTIFLRLASVSGTPLVLSPQSGFTHNLSLSIFVSIIFIARVISSTDGILGE